MVIEEEIETTRQEIEDVTNIEDVTPVELEEGQVEKTTDKSDYDKAWDNIDIDTPPEGMFGETTVVEDIVEGDEPKPIAAELDVKPTDQGLVIANPVLKYKGKEIPIESAEEMLNLAQKGFKLENEMSRIKPMKPMLKLIEDNGITSEIIQSIVDMKNGNASALQFVKNWAGITEKVQESSSFFDEAPEAKPVDKEYAPSVTKIDEVAEYFTSYTEEKPTEAAKVAEAYAEIDDAFKTEVYTSQVFPAFAQSVASGEFDRVYPYAIKLKSANPALTWVQAYATAGQRIGQGKSTEKPIAKVPGEEVAVRSNRNTPERKGGVNAYDKAFDMDINDLEQRLFG